MDYVRLYNDTQDYYGKRRVTKSRMLKEKGRIVHIDSLTSDEIGWIEHFLELMCNESYLRVIRKYYSNNTTRLEVARLLGIDVSNVGSILEHSFYIVNFCEDWLGLKYTSIEERISNKEYANVSVIELVDNNGKGARRYNAYMRAGIHTLYDFLSMDYKEILAKRGIGKISVDDIINKLKSYGYVYKGKVV